MESFSESYKSAGVDVTAGYKAVELMKPHVERTRVPGVMAGIGGFGGLFDLAAAGIPDPILVSGTDGVGTKLKLAFLMDRHDTVGIDCVAMCVNDVACAGAKPLFFLDYIALGKNEPARVADIVKGVAEGCVAAGCALVGGETAEMPGFYPEEEYDLAGFCVGAVSRGKIIDGRLVAPGDALIGVASSGVHSNGFSLVRKIFGESRERLSTYVDELSGSVGDTLLTPTRIYVKALLALRDAANLHGVAHITGGGFYENIPRMLPRGARAVVRRGSYPVPPIFSVIGRLGKVPERDMYNTFNMGLGLVVAVPAADADKALSALRQAGETAYPVGEITAGERGVEIVD